MENQNDGSFRAPGKHHQGTDRGAGRYKTKEFNKARGDMDIKVEIQQFCNLKRGKKPTQSRSNYQNSLSAVLLPPSPAVICLTGKRSMEEVRWGIAQGMDGGTYPAQLVPRSCDKALGSPEPPVLSVPGPGSPTGTAAVGGATCCPQHPLWMPAVILTAGWGHGCCLHSWLYQTRKSAQVSGERCTKGICGRSWGIWCTKQHRLAREGWMEEARLEAGECGRKGTRREDNYNNPDETRLEQREVKGRAWGSRGHGEGRGKG